MFSSGYAIYVFSLGHFRLRRITSVELFHALVNRVTKKLREWLIVLFV